MSDALNVKIAKAFLDVSGAHYPERLGVFMIVGESNPLPSVSFSKFMGGIIG